MSSPADPSTLNAEDIASKNKARHEETVKTNSDSKTTNDSKKASNSAQLQRWQDEAPGQGPWNPVLLAMKHAAIGEKYAGGKGESGLESGHEQLVG